MRCLHDIQQVNAMAQLKHEHPEVLEQDCPYQMTERFRRLANVHNDIYETLITLMELSNEGCRRSKAYYQAD